MLNSNVKQLSKCLSLLTIILILYTSIINSQTIFEKRYGGGGEERAASIDLTSDGGYIICGSTTSYGTGSDDIYLIKLNVNGTVEWSKTFGSFGSDRVHGVKQSFDNNYYLAGFMEGGFGSFDALVMKVDAVGNILWAKNFGGNEPDELRDISMTPDDGVLVSGYTSSFGFGSKDVYLIKFASDGTKEWEKIIGTNEEDHNFKNLITSSGNVILAGFSIFGDYWDATLIKTNLNGNVLWAKRYGGGGLERIHSILETSDNGFIVAGQTASFGSGGDDIFIFRTDSTGAVIWSKAYGSFADETAYGILETTNGEFFVSGQTSSFGYGGQDVFFMKINDSGNVEWFNTYGGGNNDFNFDLISTPDNGYAVLGFSFSGVLGSSDVYLIKTDSTGTSMCQTKGFNPTETNINLTGFNLPVLETNGGLFSSSNLTLTQPNSLMSDLCSIIPVELVSFTGNLIGTKVQLDWSTATEINNFGFEIERGEDINNWRTIGFIEGKGTSTETQNYNFIDDLFGVRSNQVFYRLKQIDYDGSFNYSIFVEVEITPTEFALYQNYPNPFNPLTTIDYKLANEGFISLKLYDTLGNEIAVLVNEKKPAGNYSVLFNAENLSSGVYYYILKTDEIQISKKLVLMK